MQMFSNFFFSKMANSVNKGNLGTNDALTKRPQSSGQNLSCAYLGLNLCKTLKFYLFFLNLTSIPHGLPYNFICWVFKPCCKLYLSTMLENRRSGFLAIFIDVIWKLQSPTCTHCYRKTHLLLLFLGKSTLVLSPCFAPPPFQSAFLLLLINPTFLHIGSFLHWSFKSWFCLGEYLRKRTLFGQLLVCCRAVSHCYGASGM